MEGFRAAAGPLFEAGLVDALEWDVDEGWGNGEAHQATRAAGMDRHAAGRLQRRRRALRPWGSGSRCSPRAGKRSEAFVEQLHAACRRRRYRHLSEHFGFNTARQFSRGAMFPMCRSPTRRTPSVAIACAASAPPPASRSAWKITAVALRAADAEEQGASSTSCSPPTTSFLLLDDHNVWTQYRNLGLSAETITALSARARARDPYLRRRLVSADASAGRIAVRLGRPRRAGAGRGVRALAVGAAQLPERRGRLSRAARRQPRQRRGGDPIPRRLHAGARWSRPQHVSRPEEDHELADFQDALLELMAAELPATEIARRLRADPRATPFASYVESFDQR